MKAALAPAQLLQRTGLDRLVDATGLPKLLPGPLLRMYEQLPRLQPSAPPLPALLPAIGPRRARVGLFAGCVAQAMFPQTNWATARVLQANGCDVVTPRNQTCCGAIHYHNGAAAPALDLATTNANAFNLDELDAIIINVAGCGSMLKDYGHIAHEVADGGNHAVGKKAPALERFASKVRDVSEFLAGPGADPSAGRDQAPRGLSRRVPPGARAKSPRATARTSGSGPRTHADSASRVRGLLRSGRQLQPDGAGDVRSSLRSGSSKIFSALRRRGGDHGQRRLFAADSGRRCAGRVAKSGSPIQWTCSILSYRGEQPPQGLNRKDPMSPLPTIKAVVFDFDGLMFNTEEIFNLSGKELFRRRGK